MSHINFAGKKILIYGFGREGASSLNFVRRRFPTAEVTVADDRPLNSLEPDYQRLLAADKKVGKLTGLTDLSALIGRFDVIIKAPGIPNKRVPIGMRSVLTSQTQMFLDEYRGNVIGVTGTKGKSTTASIIYHILVTAGKDAIILGNIGKPPLDFLDEKNEPGRIFVFEMSSHQLSNVTISPHIAVITNFFPEHLDYYESLADYAAAKENITRFQSPGDFLVFNEDIPAVIAMAKRSRARLSPFGKKYLREIADFPRGKLAGPMNALNILAATRVAGILKIPDTAVRQAVGTFTPLEHRLEPVGTYKGITFYNDSLATIPEATIAALDTLGQRVETIFLGGFDRGVDYSGLINRLQKSNIRTIILFPTTGKKIWDSLVKKEPAAVKKYAHHLFDNMSEAVAYAYQHTRRGKIALLSCATTSFSLFKDYRERGELFKKYVRSYGKE